MRNTSSWLVWLAVAVVGLSGAGCATYRASADFMTMQGDAASLDAPDAFAVPAPDEPEVREETAKPPSRRLMVYDGVLIMVVDSITSALESIKSVAEKAGGYMQSMDAHAIVVKIPAAAFEQAVSEVERFGLVTSKEIVGQDVTDQMRDLGIRLKNAEQIRGRLVALLERADKVEDAIAIERELARVTETIELLKGKITALEHRVAYSTLTVRLNSPLPQQIIKDTIPFPWVRALASELAQGGAPEFHGTTHGKGVSFELPKSFAKFYERDHVTRATSADGVLLKVQRHDNVDGGDLAFWTALIRRSLTDQRAMPIGETTSVKLRRGVEAGLIEGTREIGGRKMTYLVAIAQTSRYVYTFETWGPGPAFEKVRDGLSASIASMKVGGLF